MDQSSITFTPLLDLEYKPIDELITNFRTVRLSRPVSKHSNVWEDMLSFLHDQCAIHGINAELFLSRDLIVVTQRVLSSEYLRLKPVSWPIEGILVSYEVFSSFPEVWEIGRVLDEDPRPDALRAVEVDSASINDDLISKVFQQKILGQSSIDYEEFHANFPRLHSVFTPWTNPLDHQLTTEPEISPKVGAKCIAVMDCLKTTNFDQKRMNLIQSLESEDKKGLVWPLNWAMRIKDRGYFDDPVGDIAMLLVCMGFFLLLPFLTAFAAQGPEFSWVVAIQAILIVLLPFVMIAIAAKSDLQVIKSFSNIESSWFKAIFFGAGWFVLASVSAWLILVLGKLVGITSLPLQKGPFDIVGYLMIQVFGISVAYVFVCVILGMILKPFGPVLLLIEKPLGVLVRFYFRIRPLHLRTSIKKSFYTESIDASIKNTVDLMYGLSIDWYVSDVIADHRKPTVDYEEVQRVFCYELRLL